MKIISHNTMTYLKPKQWWAKIIPFVARCQSVDYKKQHELGAVGFDLRLFFDENGKVEYRHGIVAYNADNIYDVLKYANDNNIIVRVLLEIRSYNEKYISNIQTLYQYFIDFCKGLEEQYPDVKFYGGKIPGTQNVIYNFKTKLDIIEFGMYSSERSLFKSQNKFLKIIDDWCPWIYAKLMNKKNIKENQNKDDRYYMAIDFLNIQ